MLAENARRRRPGVAAQLIGRAIGAIRPGVPFAPGPTQRLNVMTSGGTVRSTFNYTLDTGVEPEIYFYEPPHGVEPRRPGDDLREMTVHNGWARAFLFSLDREGFALRNFCSSFQQWDDDDAIHERF